MTEIVFGPHRLILGDCLDVIPKIGPVDAFVTDPPYEKMKGGTSISWFAVDRPHLVIVLRVVSIGIQRLQHTRRRENRSMGPHR